MKKFIISDWLILATLIVPFLVLAFTWNMFPEEVPIHFDMDGNPDRYARKVFGLLIFPGLNILLYLFLILVPRIDPKRKNYELFEDKYRIIRLIIHLFIAFVFFVIAAYTLGYTVDITRMVMYGVIVILLVFGNYMGNIRMNYFVGIRTPWTLASEMVWRKTHRFTARLWVSACMAMLIGLPFIPGGYIIALLVFVGVITVIPIVYPYIVYRSLPRVEQR